MKTIFILIGTVLLPIISKVVQTIAQTENNKRWAKISTYVTSGVFVVTTMFNSFYVVDDNTAKEIDKIKQNMSKVIILDDQYTDLQKQTIMQHLNTVSTKTGIRFKLPWQETVEAIQETAEAELIEADN